MATERLEPTEPVVTTLERLKSATCSAGLVMGSEHGDESALRTRSCRQGLPSLPAAAALGSAAASKREGRKCKPSIERRCRHKPVPWTEPKGHCAAQLPSPP